MTRWTSSLGLANNGNINNSRLQRDLGKKYSHPLWLVSTILESEHYPHFQFPDSPRKHKLFTLSFNDKERWSAINTDTWHFLSLYQTTLFVSYRHIDNSSVISHCIGDQQKKLLRQNSNITKFKGVIRVQPGQSTEKPSSRGGPVLSVHRDTQQEVLIWSLLSDTSYYQNIPDNIRKEWRGKLLSLLQDNLRHKRITNRLARYWEIEWVWLNPCNVTDSTGWHPSDGPAAVADWSQAQLGSG